MTIIKFQSPSLRGSGRFASDVDLAVLAVEEFQSPSLRGSGRFR